MKMFDLVGDDFSTTLNLFVWKPTIGSLNIFVSPYIHIEENETWKDLNFVSRFNLANN